MKRLKLFRTGARSLATSIAAPVLAASLLASAASARVSPAPGRSAPPPGLAAPFAPTLTPSLAGSPVEGIILTDDSLATAFQPLADFDTRTGHPTVVRTLSTVRAEDPRSNDLAQAIRTFLTRARTLWGTEWVLLAGDHGSIPLRMVEVNYSETEEIATDAYYADLDGTWDANGNGIYGEVADSLDMEPDLLVGRLPVDSRAQAVGQVAKLLRYRRTPPIAPLSKHLILADVLFPRDWTPGQAVQLDGAVQAESVRAHLAPCIAPDRYYENDTKYPGTAPLTKASALAALSRGYAVVQAIQHGSRSQIAVGNELITLSDLATLSSGDSASLWVASNCASAAVDFDSFGEALLRKPFGGAIAYVGATRDSWPGVSEVVGETVTSLAVPEQGAGAPLGVAVDAARRALLPLARAETAQRWGYFETILLGDPMLHVWNCAPTPLSVSAPSAFTLGAGGFALSVTSNSAPVESALVVAVKAGEEYRAVYTDAAGTAWVPFVPASTGPFSLTVSAPNAVAFEDSISVNAAASTHFAFTSLSDDDTVHGDGDGIVDAGEKFGFAGNVKNTGSVSTVSPVTIQVEALSGNLVVEQATASIIIALAPGASAPIPSALRILAAGSPNVPRTGEVRLIARDGTRADSVVVGVSIAAASLVLSSSTLVDAPGDGDGIPESGETAAWTWRIANEGTGTSRSVTLRARTPAAGVTLLDSVATIPDLAPGASATASLPIRFSLSAPVTGRLFDLHLLDASGHAWIVPVSRGALPPAPAGLHVSGSTETSIAFAWTPSPSAALLGYHVYRALDDGSPLARVTPVPVRASAIYEAAGLALLTRYRFAVAAVDSSGNEGPQTTPIVASTTPPSAAGWPVEMAQPTSSNVTLGDLDGDGKLELVVGGDVLYAFHSDGTEVTDGDANPVSTGVFSTLLHNIPSSPAIADVDLDGAPNIVAASWNDSLVAVFRPDGSILPGWPRKGGAPFWSSPSIGDIDGDGRLEIVVGSNGSRLYAWHADGTEVRDGDANPSTDGVFFVPLGTVIASPAIADLDGDHRKEIVFGTSAGRVYAIHGDGTLLPGWPFVATGLFSSSPAVGNIVLGPDLEVAIASSNDSLYVLTAGGARAPGWPRPMELTPGNGRTVSPALAALRSKIGDPTLQVVIAGADGSVRAFEPNGALVSGFSSLSMGAPTEASPAVADLDGDGSPEILIGAEDRRLYAFAADGSSVSGFPIETGAEVRSTPAVWDLDGDGAAEIAVSGWDRKLHVWRYPGIFSVFAAPWPMWRHDNWHTGLSTFPILTYADPPPVPSPEAPPARPWLGRNYPNPFNPSTVIGFGVPGAAPVEVRVVVFDVSGRKVATLVSRRLDPGYHEVRWDGRTDQGAAAGSGIYLLRADIGPTVLTRKLALVR